MTTDTMKPWQRGIPMDTLRPIRDLFRIYDAGYALSPFTRVDDRDVATWLDEDRLHTYHDRGRLVAAIVTRRLRAATPVTDYTGAVVARMPAGTPRLDRMACASGHAHHLLQLVQDYAPRWALVWREDPVALGIVATLGLTHVATKVRASSDMVAVYGPREEAWRPDPADVVGIARLPVVTHEVAPALDAIARVAPTWAQHYSTYNEANAWTAVALRGYDPDEPTFIVKPAEMSKAWKRDHPDALTWECRDTALRDALPELEPLIAAVPGDKERIRLMRLDPDGGRLTRHADITDPDAGTRPGSLLRIHVPLMTNPRVLFGWWDPLDGTKRTIHMGAGETWYLDTRKPHAATNGGATPRVHLVMDVRSNSALLDLVSAAA